MTKLRPAEQLTKVSLPDNAEAASNMCNNASTAGQRLHKYCRQTTARDPTVSFSEVTKVETFGVKPVRLGAFFCFGSRK